MNEQGPAEKYYWETINAISEWTREVPEAYHELIKHFNIELGLVKPDERREVAAKSKSRMEALLKG